MFLYAFAKNYQSALVQLATGGPPSSFIHGALLLNFVLFVFFFFSVVMLS